MPRTFFHDVEIQIGQGSSWGEQVLATVQFSARPIVPAQTYGLPEDCYPAEGGEVEVLAVVELFIPEAKSDKLECPKWLEKMILDNLDTDDLFRSADFSPPDDDHDD